MKDGGKNKRGFRVPEEYFESLESKVTESLNKESRKGFRVPEGYFEDFEVNFNSLQESTPDPGPDRVFKLGNARVKKFIWFAAAASVLLIFGLKLTQTNQKTLDWDDLEQAEIRSWIESDLAELNAYEIAESFPDVDLDASYLSNEDLNAYVNEIELEQILYEN